jgi:hypothetical protein
VPDRLLTRSIPGLWGPFISRVRKAALYKRGSKFGVCKSSRNRSGQTAHVLFKGHKMVLKFEDYRAWQDFLLLYDPFDSNGSRLDPFDSNGSRFCGCPGKAPRAEGGRGAETSPH